MRFPWCCMWYSGNMCLRNSNHFDFNVLKFDFYESNTSSGFYFNIGYFHVCKNVSQFSATIFSECNCKVKPLNILAFSFMSSMWVCVCSFFTSLSLCSLLFESPGKMKHIKICNSVHPKCCRLYHFHKLRCYEINKLVDHSINTVIRWRVESQTIKCLLTI